MPDHLVDIGKAARFYREKYGSAIQSHIELMLGKTD